MWGTFSSKRFPFHKIEAFEGSQWGHPVTDDEAYEAVTVSNNLLRTFHHVQVIVLNMKHPLLINQSTYVPPIFSDYSKRFTP